jgi:hypothetical protein
MSRLLNRLFVVTCFVNTLLSAQESRSEVVNPSGRESRMLMATPCTMAKGLTALEILGEFNHDDSEFIRAFANKNMRPSSVVAKVAQYREHFVSAAEVWKNIEELSHDGHTNDSQFDKLDASMIEAIVSNHLLGEHKTVQSLLQKTTLVQKALSRISSACASHGFVPIHD